MIVLAPLLGWLPAALRTGNLRKVEQKLFRKRKMPSHDHCCVPCYMNRRSSLSTLSFNTFSKGYLLKKRWLATVKRDEGLSIWVAPNTVVRSAHFFRSDYSYLANCTPSSDGFSVTDRKRGYRCLKAHAQCLLFFPFKRWSFQRLLCELQENLCEPSVADYSKSQRCCLCLVRRQK